MTRRSVRFNLEILAETLSLNPNLKNKLDNCKDDKQLKALFDKIKNKEDIPEAKNIVEPIKDNNGPAVGL